MAMDSNWVDTNSLSFDLNANPLHPQDKPQMRLQTDFMGLGTNMATKQEVDVLEAELNRVNGENEKLSMMLGLVCEDFRRLQSQMIDWMNKTPAEGSSPSKKRKEERRENNDHKNSSVINDTANNINNGEMNSSSEDSCKKQCRFSKMRISKAYVRIDPSDSTLVVKDGYQWRKYGQKVTRDNPSPRAYFKCSYAPVCPVKKKVQRSVEDKSILVATYEGEHTHPHPSQADSPCGSNRSGNAGSAPSCPVLISSSSPTVRLDLTQTGSGHDIGKPPCPDTISPEFQQFLAERMATTLKKDPGFTTALANAISSRILQPSPAERW